MQHIERLSRASVMLRATWYEGTAQLLSLTELKSHLFELYVIVVGGRNSSLVVFGLAVLRNAAWRVRYSSGGIFR